MQRHALRRAYAAVAGDARSLGENHLEAMLSLLRRQRGGRAIDLPRGVRARREGGSFILTRHAGHPKRPQMAGEYSIVLPRIPGEVVEAAAGGWRITLRIDKPGQPESQASHHLPQFTAYLDPDALGEVATARTRRPGDRFQPSGMTGTKKLQDFFTDAKIPREQRDSIPLLVCERGIAWVVGHRVAEWATAEPDGDSVSVTFTPENPAYPNLREGHLPESG